VSAAEQIDRLHALKRLHERGAEFAQTLTELETVQAQLKDSLSTQGVVLTTVESSLASNMAAIDANFKSLDTRMTTLMENLAKLK
jgi:flagellar motility protein MotE (MotC chaperone)